MSIRFLKSARMKVFTDGLWQNNPIFVTVLGICSSLAVTTMLQNAIVMYLSVAFTIVLSSMLISALRSIIPNEFRIMVYMLIISTLVILIDRILKITLPEISKELGPYVGLIITNCIVMGRAEAFAIHNPPKLAALDAFGAATGYGLVLVIIGVVRELLGRGTLMGWHVMPESYETCGLFATAPGAFLALGVLILVANSIKSYLSESDSKDE